jgi:hypothetical protein
MPKTWKTERRQIRMGGCMATTSGRVIVAKAGLARFVSTLRTHLIIADSLVFLKYTRHRRWTRVAVLTETTERVGPGATGVLREDGALQPLDTPAGGEKVPEREKEKNDESIGSGSSVSSIERRTSVVLGTVGSGLRQRLQAAVSGSH